MKSSSVFPLLPLLEATEIAAVMIAAAEKNSALLVRAAPEDVPGPVRFVVVVNYGLWEVTIWRRVGWLERTLSVRAPDNRSWLRGCQRDWEGNGSIIDPLDGLSRQQRVALEHRLLLAAEMPEQDFPVDQAQTVLQAPYQPHQPRYKRK
jgi:hypothetical protein